MAAAGPGAEAAEAAGALLLVVGGECGCPGLRAFVLEELERGLRSWDLDPAVCDLDEQLKVFAARHSATFSSLVKGQRSLHHRGDVLDTLVLLNPSDKSLCDELRNLLLDPAPHKLLVLAGPCLEDTGELLLQTGGFSASHFLGLLGDREIREPLTAGPAPERPPVLTVTCPAVGRWSRLLAAEAPGLLAGRLRLRVNPAVVGGPGPGCEGLREFLASLSESLEPAPPLELLEAPAAAGFLRLVRPCCYVFPGGLGSAAVLGVPGFTLLLDGGSNPRAAFWKLLRHLDRVDAVLVTRAGADSLPGLNCLLRRKLAERALDGEAPSSSGALRGRLVSPVLGVVFLNAPRAPAAAPRLLRGPDEGALALELLRRLGLRPLPLSRGPRPAEPTVLFQKLGVGRLDLYVLHPPTDGIGGGLASSSRQSSNNSNDTASRQSSGSACALLVWLPAAPGDKVVRVLFPGCTPPARLLEGLARLQHLAFLREPVVTPQDLDAPRRADSRESLGSRASGRAPVATKAKDREPRAPPSKASAPKGQPPRRPAAAPTKKAASKEAAAPKSRPAPLENGPPSPPAAPAQDGVSAQHGLELQWGPGAPRPRSPPGPEASPTLTTPSLPAELGSPHSTEVDESLSASFEQAPANAAASGEPAGLSLPLRGGPRARRSASPHDVDLCLVSPCEFEHRKAGAPAAASPGSSNDSGRSQERVGGSPGPEETPPTSISESLPTLSDSDPPLPLAPGAAPDSDDDVAGEGFAGPALDPPPAPLGFPAPLPTPPRICMVDPELLPPGPARQRRAPARASSGPPRAATAAAATRTRGPAASRPPSARGDPGDKPSRAPPARKPSVPKAAPRGAPGPASSGRAGVSTCPPCSPVYLDLAYLPGGPGSELDQDFFSRVRALCYVLGGQDQRRGEGLRAVLDALLAAKEGWGRDVQVTLIPTFDSPAMHEWYEASHARLPALGLTVLGNDSTVTMQGEAFPACKVEF